MGKAAAEEDPRGTLQSPLTLTVTIVVVVVGFVFMSTVGEAVVGAAAGAAAGVCILKSMWDEEERKEPVAVAVTMVAGGVVGAAAAKLRSMVLAYSLTGSAIVGAIAGAAIVAIARKPLQQVIQRIQRFIFFLKTFAGIALLTVGGILLQLANNAIKFAAYTIKLAAETIKWALAKVKSAIQLIKEAAQTLFNTLVSMEGSGLAAIGALAGLASVLFGGLLGLALVVAVGAAIFGLHRIGQAQGQSLGQSQGQSQGPSQVTDMVLPMGVFLLFILICFLVTSVGVWRFCSLLFLSLLLWFLMRRSGRN